MTGVRGEWKTADVGGEQRRGRARSKKIPTCEETSFIQYYIDDFADISNLQHIAFRTSERDEPITIEEALCGDHSKQWKAAADAEYEFQEYIPDGCMC